jgi:hypothetical protein
VRYLKVDQVWLDSGSSSPATTEILKSQKAGKIQGGRGAITETDLWDASFSFLVLLVHPMAFDWV